ncbi:MAG: hypothetical protein KIT33_05005 [Candidatus Kapabacteria bacterium]|nr:hypothetical protein [Ignavibacteriota bacterium]MCW5884314.1 hypothetical protein [Candidatus Kapabacteria bacterium]
MVNYKNFILLISVVFFALSKNTFSQLGAKVNFGAGIITTNILGENRAKMPIGPTAIEGDAFIGGSFKNAQPGIQAKATFLFDSNPDIRFVTALDYMFFSGKERYGIPPNVNIAYEHSLNIGAFGLGVEYVWANLDFANAKLYTGLDLKAFYVHNIYGVEKIRYLDRFKEDDIYEFPVKDNALRFGGNVKLGVEGKLRDKFFVNAGVNIGIMNLIGRDNERGELLTPLPIFESEENMLSVLQVFILIQYNL